MESALRTAQIILQKTPCAIPARSVLVLYNTMFVHLNPNSGMPIYRQLFNQLRQRIATGQLTAG